MFDCKLCSEQIYPGERIERFDDGIVHHFCWLDWIDEQEEDDERQDGFSF